MEIEIKNQKSIASTVLKKALCIFMTMLMLVSSFGGTLSVFATYGEDILCEGQCGSDAHYILYSNGELRVTGTGKIRDYFVEESLQYNYDIVSIIIEEGITEIGEYAFEGYNKIVDIEIPGSVTEIGEGAFNWCAAIECVRYYGTQSQWNSIYIGSFNEYLLSAEFVFILNNVTDGNVTDGNVTDGNITDGNVSDGNVPDYTISAGETIEIRIKAGKTTYLKFVPTVSGEYTFSSYSDYHDPYGYLFDENKNEIDSCDDYDDLDFSITHYLEAGTTYYWGARYFDRDDSGSYYVVLVSECLHENITEHDAVEPTCATNGYTTGVYCEDCEKWIEGHELIRAKHTDENDDEICDICGKEAKVIVDSGECGSDGDNVTWTLYDDGELVISGEGEMDDYMEEETPFDEYRNSIKRIVFSTGVTSVSREAFNNFDSLETIEFSDTMEFIGYSAFEYCDSLESVIIPSSVKEIGNYVFSGCSKLKNITVVENNEYYSSDDFGVLFNKNKTALIQVPNGIEVKEYVIPDSVESIGSFAFTWCDNIEVIIIPVSVTYISNAFIRCDSLKEIFYTGTEVQWNSIEIDSDNAALFAADINFNYNLCDHINRSVVEAVEPTCTTKGYTEGEKCLDCGRVISGCEEVDFRHTDENTDGICDLCNVNLLSDIFPGETKEIEIVSNEITYLKFTPTVSGVYKFYSTSDSDTYGYLYDADKNEIVHNDDDNGYNFGITHELEAGVTYYWGARYYEESNSGKFNVTLECVEAYCSHENTTEHEAGEATCTENGYTAGVYCNDCETWIEGHDVIISDQVPHTDENDDENCDICGKSFVDSGNCGLLGDKVIWTLYDDGKLVISGEGRIGTYYEACPYWDKYSSDVLDVVVEEGITEISDMVFIGLNNLVNITLPNSLNHIGNSAFYGCSNLTSVRIPAQVSFIAAMVFCGCDNLSEIIVEKNNWNYYSADGVLFDNYDNELICYPGKKSDAVYAIPNGITKISSWAFSDNAILKHVIIPDSMSSIDTAAFQGCSGLSAVTIPVSVTSIEQQAFYCCKNLTDIYYTGTQIQWNRIEISDLNDDLLKANIHFECSPDSCAFGHDEINHAAKAPTCTEIGWNEYVTCSRCDYTTYEEISATGHDHKVVVTAPTCTAEGYTTYTCACGDTYVSDKVNALGHDEIKHEAKAPTCTEIGNEAYVTCSRCDYTTYKEIAATGHDYESVVTAPTCTEEGYTTYTCACGNSYVADKVDALGHDEISHEAKAPTCTEIGNEAYVTCSRCDYTTYKEIAATGHDYESVITASTCTEEGYTTHTCSVCGNGYTDTIVDALGHDEISHEAKAPTCTEIGWKAYVTCSRCDYTTYEEISEKGHRHNAVVTAPTCTTEGYTTYTCTCGDTYVADKVDALGHNEINHEAKAPTCTEIGWKAYVTCSRCDYTTYEEISEKGHSHNAVVTAPTCTTEGYTTYTCACGDTYVADKVNANGHKLTTLKAVAATCTMEGKTEGKQCTVCGTVTVAQKAVSKKAHTYKIVTTKAILTKNGKVENKCSVCDEVKSTTTIYYPKTIKLSATSYTYNGKAQAPSVTVKDSKGNTLKKDTDYTVKYASGRKNTGKYSVTITFKGKYSGTKTLYFNILPSKTSKITPTCSTTEIKASWKSVIGASGYRVELLNSKGKVVKKIKTTKTSYTFKKLSKVTTYKIKVTAYKTIDKKAAYSSVSTTITTSTAPAKVTLSKVTAGSKSATPAWKTVSGASGYQVQYSTSSKFKSEKTATVKKGSSKKTTIKKLTKGKKYYIKVRAYKTVNGTKVYGAWSTVKSVKVK